MKISIKLELSHTEINNIKKLEGISSREGVRNVNEEQRIGTLKVWKDNLQKEMDDLRQEYDSFDEQIQSISMKMKIARNAAAKNRFREEGFCGEYLEELQGELDSAREGLQEAEDEFNEKYRFLKAISEEIDSEIGTLN